MVKRHLNPAIKLFVIRVAKGIGFAVMLSLLAIQLGHSIDAEFEVQQAEVQSFCSRGK